jgi:hypothetical protein
MHVGVDGVRAAGAEIETEAGVKHGAARDMERARDTERHRTPREVDVRHGHLDASSLSEVRALAFPLFLSFVFSRLCVLQFLYFKASWLGV